MRRFETDQDEAKPARNFEAENQRGESRSQNTRRRLLDSGKDEVSHSGENEDRETQLGTDNCQNTAWEAIEDCEIGAEDMFAIFHACKDLNEEDSAKIRQTSMTYLKNNCPKNTIEGCQNEVWKAVEDCNISKEETYALINACDNLNPEDSKIVHKEIFAYFNTYCQRQNEKQVTLQEGIGGENTSKTFNNAKLENKFNTSKYEEDVTDEKETSIDLDETDTEQTHTENFVDDEHFQNNRIEDYVLDLPEKIDEDDDAGKNDVEKIQQVSHDKDGENEIMVPNEKTEISEPMDRIESDDPDVLNDENDEEETNNTEEDDKKKTEILKKIIEEKSKNSGIKHSEQYKNAAIEMKETGKHDPEKNEILHEVLQDSSIENEDMDFLEEEQEETEIPKPIVPYDESNVVAESKEKKEDGKKSVNDGKAAVKVCHKDGCKGTWTNLIPRGEQWIRLRRESETGCCSGWRGACDLCERPSLSKEEETMIADRNHLPENIAEDDDAGKNSEQKIQQVSDDTIDENENMFLSKEEKEMTEPMDRTKSDEPDVSNDENEKPEEGSAYEQELGIDWPAIHETLDYPGVEPYVDEEDDVEKNDVEKMQQVSHDEIDEKDIIPLPKEEKQMSELSDTKESDDQDVLNEVQTFDSQSVKNTDTNEKSEEGSTYEQQLSIDSSEEDEDEDYNKEDDKPQESNEERSSIDSLNNQTNGEENLETEIQGDNEDDEHKNITEDVISTDEDSIVKSVDSDEKETRIDSFDSQTNENDMSETDPVSHQWEEDYNDSIDFGSGYGEYKNITEDVRSEDEDSIVKSVDSDEKEHRIDSLNSQTNEENKSETDPLAHQRKDDYGKTCAKPCGNSCCKNDETCMNSGEVNDPSRNLSLGGSKDIKVCILTFKEDTDDDINFPEEELEEMEDKDEDSNFPEEDLEETEVPEAIVSYDVNNVFAESEEEKEDGEESRETCKQPCGESCCRNDEICVDASKMDNHGRNLGGKGQNIDRVCTLKSGNESNQPAAVKTVKPAVKKVKHAVAKVKPAKVKKTKIQQKTASNGQRFFLDFAFRKTSILSINNKNEPIDPEEKSVKRNRDEKEDTNNTDSLLMMAAMVSIFLF